MYIDISITDTYVIIKFQDGNPGTGVFRLKYSKYKILCNMLLNVDTYSESVIGTVNRNNDTYKLNMFINDMFSVEYTLSHKHISLITSYSEVLNG